MAGREREDLAITIQRLHGRSRVCLGKMQCPPHGRVQPSTCVATLSTSMRPATR